MTVNDIKRAAFGWLGRDSSKLHMLGWSWFATWENENKGKCFCFMSPAIDEAGNCTLVYFDTDSTGRISKVTFGGGYDLEEVSL